MFEKDSNEGRFDRMAEEANELTLKIVDMLQDYLNACQARDDSRESFRNAANVVMNSLRAVTASTMTCFNDGDKGVLLANTELYCERFRKDILESVGATNPKNVADLVDDLTALFMDAGIPESHLKIVGAIPEDEEVPISADGTVLKDSVLNGLAKQAVCKEKN
jgi:hypothetical protein